MNEREVLTHLFNRYLTFMRDSPRDTHILFPKCSILNLVSLCQEATSNGEKYPVGKLHRWLGFVQGVLAAQGVIDVDTERDYTRPLLHALSDVEIPSFPQI